MLRSLTAGEQRPPDLSELITNIPPLYLREGITLINYAEEFGISPRKLSSFIKTKYYTKFKRSINLRRIQYAKQLIAQYPTMTMEGCQKSRVLPTKDIWAK